MCLIGPIREDSASGTDSDVLVCGLSAAEVVLGEELGQLGLDAAQRLVLAVQQQHQVRHGERLAHQNQQLSEEPWEPKTQEMTLKPPAEFLRRSTAEAKRLNGVNLISPKWIHHQDSGRHGGR